ncbi:MAG: hypothetical protein ABIP12_05350 [Terriglobales bacterium]
MRPYLHTLHGYAEGPVPALVHTPQSLEALDDLLRPAPSLPRPPHFFRVQVARIDWMAVAVAAYIYLLAFIVWLYLAQ